MFRFDPRPEVLALAGHPLLEGHAPGLGRCLGAPFRGIFRES